jgi:hypothetical protein
VLTRESSEHNKLLKKYEFAWLIGASTRSGPLVDAYGTGNLAARQEEFNRNIKSLTKWIEGAIQLVVREMRKFLLEE